MYHRKIAVSHRKVAVYHKKIVLTSPGLGSGTVRIYVKFHVFWWY